MIVPELAKITTTTITMTLTLTLRVHVQTGAQTLSDYDQYSSGSDEDVVHYGLPNYDDPSRYEMPRVRPPAPMASDRMDLEQNSKKAR